MDWIQAITIIGTLGGFMLYKFSKLDGDIKSVDQKIETAHRRMDQLYNIIIDMLKREVK